MRSATHEWLATDDGFVTEEMITLYKELAGNDIGLIIPGYSYVDPSGQSASRQGAIYDDRFIPGYKKLVDTVHEYDSKIGLQIVHGGRQSKPEYIGGKMPMAPSAVKDNASGIIPRMMNDDDIAFMQKKFIEAIVRAREAGFDAVQIHAAHGFLVSQFISPYTNRRTDEYGGTTKNRSRFLVEIITKGREKVGKDFPIYIKLNSVDGIDGGLTEQESARVARHLMDAGVSLIEVSGGIGEAGKVTARPDILEPKQEAYFAAGAREIKKLVGKKVIVSLVGGLRSLEVMQRIIDHETADLVSLSRPFIREPDLVTKLNAGDKRHVDCISCNGCYCHDGIRCVIINP